MDADHIYTIGVALSTIALCIAFTVAFFAIFELIEKTKQRPSVGRKTQPTAYLQNNAATHERPTRPRGKIRHNFQPGP
jgi:hypothetical protein